MPHSVNHPLWESFITFAEDKLHIDMDDEENREAWWECYAAGAEAGAAATVHSVTGPLYHDFKHLKEELKKIDETVNKVAKKTAPKSKVRRK